MNKIEKISKKSWLKFEYRGAGGGIPVETRNTITKRISQYIYIELLTSGQGEVTKMIILRGAGGGEDRFGING